MNNAEKLLEMIKNIVGRNAFFIVKDGPPPDCSEIRIPISGEVTIKDGAVYVGEVFVDSPWGDRNIWGDREGKVERGASLWECLHWPDRRVDRVGAVPADFIEGVA